MSQSTFSKYLHAVIPALNMLAERFIMFPRTQEERQSIEARFRAKLQFPGVLGAIDCTLPKLHTPAEHQEAFVNHHQNHSLNVQVVSDVDYNIMDIRICSGSTNDQFIWNNSDMRNHLYQLRNDQDIVREEGHYYIIGDNGYTPSTVLLTSDQFAAPNSPEFAFSQRVRKTRCVVEQVFGIWQVILRCLNKDKALHYKPQFCAEIVKACAVLYNFLRHEGVNMPVPQMYIPRHQHIHHYAVDEKYIDGLRTRQRIINEYFRA